MGPTERKSNLDETQPIRWMVVFYHSDGGSRDEVDFPDVEFWRPNRATAMEKAARVLVEWGDQREWVAAGNPAIA